MAAQPNESADQNESWKVAAREQQQFFYEGLGDRDWDCFKRNEMKYLEMNVGHAIFGPPVELPDKEKNENTGYLKEQLKTIRGICATVIKHGKHSYDDSDVWISVIYVCLEHEGNSVPVAIFRIPNYDITLGKDLPDQFVDCSCRVYEDWDDFLNNNQLPETSYCYPKGGVYDGDDKDQVLLEFGLTPAKQPGRQLCSSLDSVSTVVSAGSLGVGLLALATPVAAPILAVSAAGAMCAGAYGTLRSVFALRDMDKHKQDMSLANPEARNCYLSVAGNVLGMASGQAVKSVTKMTQNGEVVGRAGRWFVNALNVGSLTVNGIGLINTFDHLLEKRKAGELGKLEVFQFASSCLFFSMSVVNIKTAGTIIKETQSRVISDFEASLRSNRHRKAFRKVANKTRGEDGYSVKGNAKVIKGITHITNKDDFCAGLVRIKKQVGKSRATVTLTDKGSIQINGHLEVDPMEFSRVDKAQRQVLLDVTKNVTDGTMTQEQCQQRVQAFCQKHNINLELQRTETFARIEAVGSNVDTRGVLREMSNSQIDVLSSYLWKFAKEHHNLILSIAVELFEHLGFKRTAEFLRVVQFFTNYVERVANEMERNYQADLQSAQLSQGQDFNREKFDNEYHIEGKRMESFTKSVLYNPNTREVLSQLKRAHHCMFPSGANPPDKGNDKDESGETKNKSHTSPDHNREGEVVNGANPPDKGNARDESGETKNKSHTSPNHNLDGEVDVVNGANPPDKGNGKDESVETKNKSHTSPDQNLDDEGKVVHRGTSSVIDACSIDEITAADHDTNILYKKHRDFKKYGDLSDNEIYRIVEEVTGLLCEGNMRLYRDGETTFVSATAPHIIPLSVVVHSNRQKDTVTASLIL